MPKPQTLAAPSFDPLQLEDLVAGAAVEFSADVVIEGRSFARVDEETLVLDSATLIQCRIDGLRASELGLQYARLSETAIAGLDVPVLRMARGTWRDVEVDASRSGSIEAYESTWRGVHFTNCRLGFVNLRGSNLEDVAFTDCTIDELDLGQSKINRFAANGTRVSQLVVEQASLRHVDLRGAELDGIAGVTSLRGATISSAQLHQLAPLLAADRGIAVRD